MLFCHKPYVSSINKTKNAGLLSEPRKSYFVLRCCTEGLYSYFLLTFCPLYLYKKVNLVDEKRLVNEMRLIAQVKGHGCVLKTRASNKQGRLIDARIRYFIMESTTDLLLKNLNSMKVKYGFGTSCFSLLLRRQMSRAIHSKSKLK